MTTTQKREWKEPKLLDMEKFLRTASGTVAATQECFVYESTVRTYTSGDDTGSILFCEPF